MTKKKYEIEKRHRDKLKTSGAFYAGAFIRGDAARLLTQAKAQQQKSFSALLNQAVISAFGKAGAVETPQPVIPSALEDQRWEELK